VSNFAKKRTTCSFLRLYHNKWLIGNHAVLTNKTQKSFAVFAVKNNHNLQYSPLMQEKARSIVRAFSAVILL
jgi:hypothetical protein